jgi:hypothetical protein
MHVFLNFSRYVVVEIVTEELVEVWNNTDSAKMKNF